MDTVTNTKMLKIFGERQKKTVYIRSIIVFTVEWLCRAEEIDHSQGKIKIHLSDQLNQYIDTTEKEGKRVRK